MNSDLGLNDHHQLAIVNYIRFARFQRSQCLKAIAACFHDVKDTRLIEETYTQDEIEEILTDIETTIRSEVESELINSAHTNAILLRQLFCQAEQWHLKLQADTSEFENSELLTKIKNFEEQELIGVNRERTTSPVRTKLEPMNESGGTMLLQKRIDELMEENENIQTKLLKLEPQVVAAFKEKNLLSEQVNTLRAELELRSSQEKSDKKTNSTSEVEAMQNKLQQLQMRIVSMETNTTDQSLLEKNLEQTKHELLKVKSQLEIAQQELEKNFNQTSAYNNMKKIMVKKNEQLKELRSKLARYEPSGDHNNED